MLLSMNTSTGDSVMKNSKARRGWLTWKKIERNADERRRNLHPDQGSRAFRSIGTWVL